MTGTIELHRPFPNVGLWYFHGHNHYLHYFFVVDLLLIIKNNNFSRQEAEKYYDRKGIMKSNKTDSVEIKPDFYRWHP